MAPLKFLETQHPILDAHFQDFCASRGIYTVEDFLLHDIYRLAALAEQRSNRERLKQGITQIMSMIDGMRQPWFNGMGLLEDAENNKHVLSTGYQGIDSILQGGVREGQLTELVGPSSSGKTQVCLHLAANVGKNYTGSVFYLDTGNSFSAQRIAYFLDRISCCTSDQARNKILEKARNKIFEKVLCNIFCHSVFDIFALFDVLRQLEIDIRSQTYKGDNEVRMVIVDSISSLITPVLGGSNSQGHALMVAAGVLLKKLAFEHNIAVLVTNHTVGGDSGLPKPALGESWKTIPHVRLLLSRERENNICNVSILKHSSGASDKTARIEIYG